MRPLLKALSSLRFTVVLLGLSTFLVFAGTWAQIDMGIWATLKTYFRSFYVFIPFQIFLPREWNVPGGIPFPGGYVIGTLLMFNLLAAHAARFSLSWKRSGILLIHFGLIMLIVGELVTALYATEANMSIDEGETVNYAEDVREMELAIVDVTDPNEDRVVVIPESHLIHRDLIESPDLPFDLRIEEYFLNSNLYDIAEAPLDALAIANRGLAVEMNVAAVEAAVVSGVKQNQIDLPVAYVTPIVDDRPLGTWMASLYFTLTDQPDQLFEVDGRTYRLALRYRREYKPYSLSLIDFRHDRYLGTETPMNFSSEVRLVDERFGEDREVLIYMNNPLRYRGETFYQASFKKGDGGTVLQVVRNPGWLVPYIAVTLGALGMTIHFSMHLGRFLRRKRAT